MVTADSVKGKIISLIDKANAVTGKTDADMTSAVDALIAGYGNSGGNGFLTAPVYKSVDGSNYRLVYNEDFNGTDIDKNYWCDSHFISRVENRYQAWTDYYLKDSLLHLRIKKDAPNRYNASDGEDVAVTAIQTGETNKLHKTSPFYHDVNPFWGLITQEGYYECRFKVFKATGGCHTAWWCVGVQDGKYQDLPRVEIDITEILANQTTVLPHGMHELTDENITDFYVDTPVDVDFSEDFHTVGFLWENGSMKWYLDGQLIDTQQDIMTPQYPVMHFLAAYKRRSGTGWTSDADTTLDDVEFLVDYLKIYKKADTLSSGYVTIAGQEPIHIDAATADMSIDSERGCIIDMPSYVYINWSDGSRTEHWVKWEAVKETYTEKIANNEDFDWLGYVYGLGIEAVASITGEERTYLTFAVGNISGSDGTDDDSTTVRMRSDYIAVDSTISFTGCPWADSWTAYDTNAGYCFRCYDADKTFIGSITDNGALFQSDIADIALPEGTAYIRIIMQKNSMDTPDIQAAANPIYINGSKYYIAE